VLRLGVLLLVALLLTGARTAHAASVVVLRPAARSPELTEALFRLQGELLAVGLKVELDARPAELAADAISRDAWLERMAAERSVDAVIDIVGSPSPLGADVWILPNASRGLRAVRVAVEAHTPNRAETLAIRSIEVLRANFLVMDVPHEDPRDSADLASERPPEPSSKRTPAEPEAGPKLGIAVGATLLTGTDGVGPALLPLVRVHWAFYEGLGVEATLSGFGTRPSVGTEAGSVSIAQEYGLVGLRYATPSEAWLAAFFTLSAGTLRTTLEGSADPPERGHHIEQWAFLTEGSVGGRLELSERYWLCLAGHVQWAAPYTAIHVVSTEVATTGHPNLAASLAVGASL